MDLIAAASSIRAFSEFGSASSASAARPAHKEFLLRRVGGLARLLDDLGAGLGAGRPGPDGGAGDHRCDERIGFEHGDRDEKQRHEAA